MKEFILLNLTNVYTLSVSYTTQYNDEWNYVLDASQRRLYDKNDEYIIGYMVINRNFSGKGIEFVEHIDTRIARQNLAMYMLKKYQDDFSEQYEYDSALCLPRIIHRDSCGFWKKYFEREYGMKSLESLYMLIDKYGIKSVIYWVPLFDAHLEYSRILQR